MKRESAGIYTSATFVVDHKEYAVSTVLADIDSDHMVTVYCVDQNYRQAVSIISLKFWIIAYTLLGAVIVWLVFWIYKTLHKTHHATVLIKENYH